MGKKKDDGRLRAVVKAQLVKPLDKEMTWNEAGEMLLSLKRGAHRAMNKAITCMALCYQAARFQQKPRDFEGVHMRTLSYQEVARGAIEEALRMDDVSIPSHIVLGMAGEVYTRFCKWRKGAYMGDSSLPSFRYNGPIFFPGGQYGKSWGLERVEKNNILWMMIRRKRYEFVIAVEGGSAHAHLRRIRECADGVKPGSIKIVRETSKGKPKWLVHISYSWPRPPLSTEPGVIAVHRGIRTFLTAVGTDGWAATVMDGGDAVAFHGQMVSRAIDVGKSIREHKTAYAARRSSLQRHKQELGKGACGHGKKRRYATYRALSNKEARWVHTKCQQVAARVVAMAKERRAGTIVIEDYQSPLPDGDNRFMDKLNASWPFGKMKDAISYACDKAGIVLLEVPSNYISQRCPYCGTVEKVHVVGAKFVCTSCDYKRPVDTTAAFNMLISAGYEDSVRSAIERGRRLLAAFRAVSRATAGPECDGISSQQRGVCGEKSQSQLPIASHTATETT